LKAKKLPLLIALIALIGTFTSVIPQQAFADGTITKPAECTLVGPDFRPLAIAATHTLTFTPVEADVDVTYTETPNGDPPSQLAVIVLDPGSGNAQFVPIVGGSATATFVGAADGQPHTVVVCAGMLATSTSLNTLVHTLSNNFYFLYITSFCGDGFVDFGETCDDGNIVGGDGCSATCQLEVCDNSVVDPGEQCDPPDGVTCDDFCQLILASDGTVIGSTSVPQFCGAKQLTVITPPNFTPVQEAINYGEVINLQVSPERTLRIANTGGGDAVVTTDLTLVDSDGETTLWQDLLLNDVFDRCSTRSSSTSPSSYATMTEICDNPFIEVLPAQTDPESTFVDRFLRVRPDVPDTEFAGPPVRDVITYTQILRLEVSCDPVATCPPNADEFNGACVIE